MTQLLAHRDTLAAVIRAAVIDWNTLGTAKVGQDVSQHLTDALLASGAVRDAASLSNDEALVREVDSAPLNRVGPGGVRSVLAALAAALAPTEEKA